jgi:hypothetical protein
MDKMDIYKKPLPKSGEAIKRSKTEWMQINPFLSEEEAKKLEDNPPIKPDSPKFHDYPL